MEIRDAGEEISRPLQQIYNDAVKNSTAIWRPAIDAANRLAWLSYRQKAGYPVLVAVNGAEGVLGFASSGDWRAWDGYRHDWLNIRYHVRADQRGKDVSEALMHALIKEPGE